MKIGSLCVIRYNLYLTTAAYLMNYDSTDKFIAEINKGEIALVLDSMIYGKNELVFVLHGNSGKVGWLYRDEVTMI